MRPALAVALGVLPTSDFRRCLVHLAGRLYAYRLLEETEKAEALRAELARIGQIESDRERHAAMLELAAREGWSGGGRA